jgi:hypothetical protein
MREPTKFTKTAAHAIHGRVVLARVARVRNQAVDGPSFHSEKICRILVVIFLFAKSKWLDADERPPLVLSGSPDWVQLSERLFFGLQICLDIHVGGVQAFVAKPGIPAIPIPQ